MDTFDRGVLIESADDLTTRRDKQLVSEVRAGVPDAFTELHALYSRRLYKRIGTTRNFEDAEDALPETFLRAHFNLHAFQDRSGIYSWLTRIAINSALICFGGGGLVRRHCLSLTWILGRAVLILKSRPLPPLPSRLATCVNEDSECFTRSGFSSPTCTHRFRCESCADIP
jgi:hypothetical protein